MKKVAHFPFFSSPSQGGSRRKALAFALTFAGSLQGQTAITDLHLSGTNNQITNGAEMTVLSGGSLTAAAGSVIDLFHATVALPPALTLRNLRLDGASTELINGARLTLLTGSTFAAAPGSTMDLSSADISFPTTVVLTTGEQTLTGKTLVSPIISAVSAPATSNLSLTAGSAGASLTLGAGADASASFTGLRLVLADGPYTSDYVSVPNMFIGLGAGKAGNRSRANIGIGINALGNATTASENIAIGWNALAMTDGIPPAQGSHMIAIGPQALEQNTTGGDHVAIGRRSMQNNTTGVDNTAVGFESLIKNTVGSYTVALGNIALHSNTTGYHSVAVGQSALTSAVSSENTAVGANAGFRTTTGTRNVFVGFEAAWENLSGSNNTALGVAALANSRSSNNTAVGNGAGLFNISGSNNTFLGTASNAAASNLNNATSIGYQASATASDQIALGNSAVTHLQFASGPMLWFGTGSPENIVTAPTSSLFLRTNGSSGTSLYVKEPGPGSNGWRPLTTGVSGTEGNVLVNGGVSAASTGSVTLSLPTALTAIRSVTSDTGALVLTPGSSAGGVVRVDDTPGYGGAELYINGGNYGFSTLTMRRLTSSNGAKINLYTGSTHKWDFGLDGDGTDNLMIYNRSTGTYPLRLWAADNTLSLNATVDATLGGAGTLKTAGGIYAAQKIIAGTDVVAGGNIVAAGGTFTGSTAGLVLNSGLRTQPIVFKLSTTEIARFSGTNGNLLLGGTTDMAGSAGLKVFGTTDSSSATSGALQVVGGAGIGGSLFIGRNLNFANAGVITAGGSLALTAGGTNQNISLTPSGLGRVVIAGPLGLTGDQTLGGSLNLPGGGSLAGATGSLTLAAGGTNQNIALTPSGTGGVVLTGPLTTTGQVTLTSTADSTSTGTGALVISGGASIRKKTSLGDDLVLTPTASTAATVRLSGTAITDVPGLWFRDGGSPTATNVTLSSSAFTTILNGPPSGSLSLRVGNTNYLTLNATSATLQTIPLRVISSSASTSTTTGSGTFGGGIGVSGRTSTGSLSVGAGPTVNAILSVATTLDFPSVSPNGGVQDLTVAVSGATLGNDVSIVEAGGSFAEAGLVVRGIVSATGTVTVRATNVTTAAINPAALSYRVTVTKF